MKRSLLNEFVLIILLLTAFLATGCTTPGYVKAWDADASDPKWTKDLHHCNAVAHVFVYQDEHDRYLESCLMQAGWTMTVMTYEQLAAEETRRQHRSKAANAIAVPGDAAPVNLGQVQ